MKRLIPNEFHPLIPLYITMFLEAVGSGLVAAVLTVIARDDLGCSNFQLGIIFSCYNAAQIIGSVIMGHFADVVRRKYVLMFTLSWVGCGYILTGFSRSFAWLLVSRTVTGLCGASFSIGSAILTANIDADRLPFAIGRLATAASLGFAIGPLISSALTAIWDINMSSPFYLRRMYFFVISGVYFIAAFTASRLNSKLSCPSKMATTSNNRKHPEGCVTAGLCLIWSSRFFSTSAVTTVYVTQVYMWREYLDLDSIQISFMFAGSGIAVSAFQGIVFPFLVKRIGFHSSLITGIACIAVGCAAIGPITVYTQFISLHVVCLVIFWFGVACMEPGTIVAVSRHLKQSVARFTSGTPKRPLHTGLAMGITSAMKYAASLSIPPLAGHLYDHHRVVAHYMGAGIACIGVTVVLVAARVYHHTASCIPKLAEEKVEESCSVEDQTTETTVQQPEEEAKFNAV